MILNDTIVEHKRNFLIERLTAMKVYKSQDGKSIYELDYDTLKYELVLASFREIDTKNENHRWF